jgi:hypothetical protein
LIESYAALCTIVEQNGKRTLKIYDRDEFVRALEGFGVGEDLDLEIRTLGRKRTRQQEKYFHGPVLKAFMNLGYRKQEAKDMLCLTLIPREIRLTDGSSVRVPGHTSELSVEEYSELIDASIRLAAEQGEVVEDSETWKLQQERKFQEAQA